MGNRDWIIQIKKRRQAGLSDEQIKATLINAGLKEEDLDAIIKASYHEPEPTPEELSASQRLGKPKKRWWPF